MFHDIEELRKADNGYVYWCDVCVEHYSFPYDQAGQDCEREAAHKLAERCRAIEARGEAVSWGAILREGMWDGVKAPQPVRDAALALCAKYAINGVCDPGYVANVIHAEQTAEPPYVEIPEWNGAIYPRRRDALPGGGAVDKSYGLTFAELCAVDDRPWRGKCATSGATMRDYADALAAVDAPAWVKRATVALCRSYASSIDWRTDAVDVATVIRAAVDERPP